MRYRKQTDLEQPVKRGPKKKEEHLRVEAVGTTARRCDIELIESVHGNLSNLLRQYIKELVSKIEQNGAKS